jgi:hypothetical protein
MTSLLTRAFGWLLAGLLLAAGLVFTASLVVAALLFGVVAVAASLLRGEKPSLRMPLGRGFGGAHWPGWRTRRGASQAEIVDVEAREVPDTQRRIEHKDARAD